MPRTTPFSRRVLDPRLCLASLAVVFAVDPSAAQHKALQSAIAHFEARLAADVAKDGIGAISAAVMVDDQIRWANGFGWADVRARVPATADTIYRTGSISKSITGVAMARLHDKGELTLDDKVVVHLPAFGRIGDGDDRALEITLRQLACHSSGLIREPRLRGAAAGPIANWEEKILESIPKTTFQNDPGERYAYSNIGYGILGLTISKAARKPYMKLVEAEIFRPLGMKHSTFIISDDRKKQLAAGYANGLNGDVNAAAPAREHAGRGYKVPNGGVYATVGDLCRFAAGLYASSDFLLEKTRTEVLRVQTPGGKSRGYGLGFTIVGVEPGMKFCSHGGSVAGYTAYLVFDPKAKVAVSILRNYNRGTTNLGRVTSELLREIVELRSRKR